MNGIKCYLSREEVRKILSEAIVKRLEPERLLGPFTQETTLFDDGRVEVTFCGVEPETASGGEKDGEKQPVPAQAPIAAG
ncbi:MAG: hypothetical protein IIB65_09300 [Proteobacteria bacterium]|nr:hypothetical protein [Pseudomonadota bacterium]MCH8095796.1 hypothetical protein [Pseudomonadota bacterium]